MLGITPAGGVNLATGFDNKPDPEPAPDREAQPPASNPKRGATHAYYVDAGLVLPNGDFLLILRNTQDKEGPPANVRDVAGNYYKSADVEEEQPLCAR